MMEPLRHLVLDKNVPSATPKPPKRPVGAVTPSRLCMPYPQLLSGVDERLAARISQSRGSLCGFSCGCSSPEFSTAVEITTPTRGEAMHNGSLRDEKLNMSQSDTMVMGKG